MAPRITVVVPAFDQPDYLAEALRSVAAQTVDDFEVVVVDDGSPRDLRAAAESAGLGERLRLVRQDNAGGSAARNRGVALARGEWVAFLDHDDRWLPHKLERTLAAVEGREDVGLVYCRYRLSGDEATPEAYPDQAPSGRILAELLRRTLIRTLSTVTIRRDVLSGAAWFRDDLTIANDIELYFRVAERADAVFVPEVLVEWRRHGGSASADKLRTHEESLRVVEEVEARLSADLSADLRRVLRTRLARHALGAASAARRNGDRAMAHAYYRRALACGGARGRALWGLVRTFGAR